MYAQKISDHVEPPFMIDPVAIVVRKGSGFAFVEWRDLKGRKGVTNEGESFGDKFDAFMGSELTVVLAAGVDKAFAALLAQQADYMIIGLYPGRNEAARRWASPARSNSCPRRWFRCRYVCRILQEIQMRRAARGLWRGHQGGRRWGQGAGVAGRRRAKDPGQ